MEIFVRPMTPADMDCVLEIEQLSFDHPFAWEFFESELKRRLARVYVAVIDGKIAGYIDYWIVMDEIHLLNLAVHPDFRRQGVAGVLFEFMTSLVKVWKTIYLEVRLSNIPAKKFYKKMGFKTAGFREKYYPDGESAVVMVLPGK